MLANEDKAYKAFVQTAQIRDYARPSAFMRPASVREFPPLRFGLIRQVEFQQMAGRARQLVQFLDAVLSPDGGVGEG